MGLVDLDGLEAFKPFATTKAWCWQQGTMLQWLPDATCAVVYNHRQARRFEGVVHDLVTGKKRELERAVYAVAPQGRYAIGLNFARLATHRPGYGYEGVRDPWANHGAPSEDGVWRIDMDSGRAYLVLSLAEVVSLTPEADIDGQMHWLNHAQINTDGTRIAVLHRWQPSDGPRQTRLITLAPDGSDARVIWPARLVSHYDWRSADEILAWGGAPVAPNGFWQISDAGAEPRVFASDVLTEDGHCSYSPDRTWIANDTYPDDQYLRRLMIVRAADGLRVDLGAFHAPPGFDGPLRVDLHPRWNRDGTALCIDSAHEGTRQMYTVDLRPALAAAETIPVEAPVDA